MKSKIRYKILEIIDDNLRKEYLNAINNVYKHGRFILGPEIDELEENLSEITKRKHCITVSNGTMSLIISLLAMKKKYPNKREVILPSYGWIASAQAIIQAGLTPVFADITNQLFIDTKTTKELINDSTLGIMIVDFSGRIGSNIHELVNLSEKFNIPIIEDCAQAFGAWNSSNQKKVFYSAGSIGEVSCLSINPMKTLASHGEGGAILTDDDNLASFARRFRYQGMEGGLIQDFGINARMETLQASITLVNLSKYEQIIDKKRSIAEFFNKKISKYVETPKEDELEQHTFFSYQILTKERDNLRTFLDERNIETQIQHYPLMPHATPFENCKTSTISNAIQISSTSLCLPCHENLSQDEIITITNEVENFFNK